MKKSDVVKLILKEKHYQAPLNSVGKSFAPTNIALCKYWGKRNQEINLPVTSSLSISLGDKGATAEIKLNSFQDEIKLNGSDVALDSSFSQRLINYLNLFRQPDQIFFSINIVSNIPIAAGLASSACGFASIILALNALFGWQLLDSELSILARLGSGSASRSIWQGFVEWHAGSLEDGMDSYAQSLSAKWPELCIGLLIFNNSEKSISSREAMQRTVATSPLYSAWPDKVAADMIKLKDAISTHDFKLLGETAESNAMTMHATMLSAWPAVCYYMPETIMAMQKIWKLRTQDLEIYFTQDAGPNLKLLFLKKDITSVLNEFNKLEIIRLFDV
ncbi:MAG: diphosphomevalonate decarboxylase [Gammaproteobacteria bacterium]|nr:diphosphomevalonate decarboxylase [Gammaproteobacteria bacterium]